MNLLIVTHTPHWAENHTYYAYGPYIREMNLWIKLAKTTTVIAPLAMRPKSDIHWKYEKKINYKEISGLSFLSFRESVRSLFKVPIICYRLYVAMRQADHIHLRCPGNIGLLGCFVQMAFPRKKKTAKYAGNWDPNAAQPFSYNLQKKILSNTRLTKNMQVLAYGEWPGDTYNIKPFFTASYPESYKINVTKDFTTTLRFLFVGSLVSGKRPAYALELVASLTKKGYPVQLEIYGDGALKNSLEKEAMTNVIFYGNTNAAVVYEAYRKAHFLILPSKSEGWPKVIAEAMFCGAIPIASAVSCIPWMLDYGKRGMLLSLEIEKDSKNLELLINNKQHCLDMSKRAQQWSQQYTLDSFEQSIQKLLE